MLQTDLEISFGEWLPDLPYYRNPGLSEALNAIPVDATYKDYIELMTADDALPDTVKGAYASLDSSGDSFLYAATASDIYLKSGSSWNAISSATYSTAADGYWRFTQFDELIIGTNYADTAQAATVGGSTFAALATTGTSPRARHIGIVNRFVMLGDTDGVNGTVPHRVQWSAIDDPRNWPTPNTSTARAFQSGEQVLPAVYGAVTGIAGGEFYGLIFQQRAINRFTYVGGDVVFQVQDFEKTRGNWFPQSMVQIGQLCFFIAADGFYVTDGQNVKPIGDGRVDKFFLSDCDQSFKERVTVAVDYQNKCIFWSYPNASAIDGLPNQLMIYNWTRDRWAHAEDEMQLIFSSIADGFTLDQLDSLFTSIDDMTITLDSSIWQGGSNTMMGFGSDGKLGTFSGESKTARFESGESDLNPTGYVFIRGAKPLITGNPSNITISIGTRTSQDNQSRSFGGAVQRTARTGVCDFRVMARYPSLRVEIEGGFDRAIGVQLDGEMGDLV